MTRFNDIVRIAKFQPEEFTEEMIRSAFKIWLGDVSLWKCPLVSSNGTLLKFSLKPGNFKYLKKSMTSGQNTNARYKLDMNIASN